MLEILAVTTPIYLIIGLGFWVVRQGYMAREHLPVLGQFLLRIVLPVLVFRTIISHPLHEVLNLSYLLVYGTASALVYAVGVWYALRLHGGKRVAMAAYGMGMAASNSVFVGFPILLQLLGPATNIAMALCLLIENLLIIPVTLVIAEAAEGVPWQRAWWASLKQLGRNPMFIGIVLGFAVAAIDVQMPAPLDKTLQILAGAAGPLALFMIGGALVGRQVKGQGRDITVLVAGKLLLHPLLVLLLLWLLPPFEPALQMAALLFACMPLPATFMALFQRYHWDGFCAAALVVSTVVSFITLNTWLALAPALMDFIHTGILS